MRSVLQVLLAVIALSAGCSNGGTVTCDPTPRCTPEGQIVACHDGVTYFSTCESHDACFAGQCAPIICKPSFFFCDGMVADECDASGTQHTRTNCALQGAKCVVGATAATCEPLACTPSQIYCAPDGSEVRKCAGDGGGYVVVQTCDDPQQRGNHCAGAACRDRCELTEAQDRSTLGCRFLGSAFDAPLIHVANPQPDLAATVTIAQIGGAPVTLLVPPGQTAELASTATARRDTSQVARALIVTSSVPVYVWDFGAPHALHPEHVLSSTYLAALDGMPPYTDVLSVTAILDDTQVTVKPTGAITAGGPIAATPAGTPIVRTLNRGEVLTLASTTVLAGTSVAATAPVTVEVANTAGHSATMPGVDTLGRDYILFSHSPVVAPVGAVVTAELEGTITLAAGEWALFNYPQRIHASAPILVAGPTVVPSVEQMLTTSYSIATTNAQAFAPSSTILTPLVDVATSTSGTFASALFQTSAEPYSAASPFWLVMLRMPVAAVPGPYGLAILP